MTLFQFTAIAFALAHVWLVGHHFWQLRRPGDGEVTGL